MIEILLKRLNEEKYNFTSTKLIYTHHFLALRARLPHYANLSPDLHKTWAVLLLFLFDLTIPRNVTTLNWILMRFNEFYVCSLIFTVFILYFSGFDWLCLEYLVMQITPLLCTEHWTVRNFFFVIRPPWVPSLNGELRWGRRGIDIYF